MISIYQVFGWINVGIILIIATPFILKTLSKNNTKSVLFKVYKSLRPAHRVLGGLLVITSFLHGMLALGSLSLHTGTILGLFVVLVGFLGGSFILIKKKPLFKLHIVVGYITILILLVHLFKPSIL